MKHSTVFLILLKLTIFYANTRASAKYQWNPEDEFCDRLHALTFEPKLCDCETGLSNQLVISCVFKEELSTYSEATQLEQTFTLLQDYGGRILLSELALFDISSLISLNFSDYPTISFERLKLVNLQNLNSIESNAEMHRTLRSIELINTSLSLSSLSTEFFNPRFENLHTVLITKEYSDDEEIPAIKKEKVEAKCSSICRLSLNHHCLSTVRLNTLPANLLTSLCNIETLDLSCLEMKNFETVEDFESLRRVNVTGASENLKPIYIDMSQNSLYDVGKVIEVIKDLPVPVNLVLDQDREEQQVYSISFD